MSDNDSQSVRSHREKPMKLARSSGRKGSQDSIKSQESVRSKGGQRGEDVERIRREFRDSLIKLLVKKAPDLPPIETDFGNFKGYELWTSREYRSESLAALLADLIKTFYSSKAFSEREDAKREHRDLSAVSAIKQPTTTCSIWINIKQAKDLGGKGAKTRNYLTRLTLGDTNLETDVVEENNNPRWDTEKTLLINNTSENILFTVMKVSGKAGSSDRDRKATGIVAIETKKLIDELMKSGFATKEYELQPVKGSKSSDGGNIGKIVIQANMASDMKAAVKLQSSKDSTTPAHTHIGNILHRLTAAKVRSARMFEILHYGCCEVDLRNGVESVSQSGEPSEDANNVLFRIAKLLKLPSTMRAIILLSNFHQLYKEIKVSVACLKLAWDRIGRLHEQGQSLSSKEQKALLDVVEQMHATLIAHVSQFQISFPEEIGKGHLKSALLLVKALVKAPFYAAAHPNGETFDQQLHSILHVNLNNRYSHLHEQAQTTDLTDAGHLKSLIVLSEELMKELEAYKNFYSKEFPSKLNFLPIATEIWLKLFAMEMMNMATLSPTKVDYQVDDGIFRLLRITRTLESDYLPLVKEANISFDIDDWFSRFVFRWIETIEPKTLTWVDNAISSDKFVPEDDRVLFSSSISDLFKFIETEMLFIQELDWPKPIRMAEFYAKFMNLVVKCLEHYCEKIRGGSSILEEAKSFNIFTSVAASAPSKQIDTKDCVKLSNIEECKKRLKQTATALNLQKLLDILKAHGRRKSDPLLNGEQVEGISGTFRLEIAFAENLKSCDKSFVCIKSVIGNTVPDVLVEIAKSSVMPDTINPIFEQSFQIALRRVKYLEVIVYNKNRILAASVIGSARLTLTENFCDDHTHDIWMDLAPQGKILLRLAKQGDRADDIEFQFRKAQQVLTNHMDDAIRILVVQLIPTINNHIKRLIHDNSTPVTPGKFSGGNFPWKFNRSSENLESAPSFDPNAEMSLTDTDEAVATLFEYLNDNFSILASNLSENAAQETIFKVWSELLISLESALIPPLYGEVGNRIPLNPRQVSLVRHSVDLFFGCFHADGQGIGIPQKQLETARYKGLKEIFSVYSLSAQALMDEYTKSISVSRRRKPKVYILQLLRLKTSELSSVDGFIKEALLKRSSEQTS